MESLKGRVGTPRLLVIALLTIALSLGLFTATSLMPSTVGQAHAASISKKSITLVQGQAYKLKVKGAKAKKVKWSSNKKSVATVSKSGTVTAKKAGKATITAKYKKKKYKCVVTTLGINHIMAGMGAKALYDNVRFPSSLHIDYANYEGSERNGYGESIKRLTVRGYAKNGFGGYGDVYAVVIQCKSNKNYDDAFKYKGYYYSVSVYSSNPSLTYSGNMSNSMAAKAYRHLYPRAKAIPFD